MQVADLRRLLEYYKSQGIVFDLVCVDYADLMRPERVTDNVQENSKNIYQTMRGLAMAEGFALLTATQTNREGAKKAVATMTDVAEDINKIRIADIVISINKTEEERAMNRCRLHFAASRNQRSGFSLLIEQNFDRAKFITKVIGEE
jgi:replicative DNA helicase